MHLKKIKLSGFKSFVDPTMIALPSNLVSVVGPNGCGKSNIIDAVCWVMGESSAKYLRGESLTDVIFNGSTARKPIGQASVELIFDNQDGAIGGEYASYAEISIRRVLTRDGDSQYFLNGARCRRRDIIDIFLGTGLGPRSYSIIGQNMISRIIEAKPDDMRIYLEEAAGVSKYKERRRETENRINHTKENLARLSDVRSELEKQLNSLKRQANTAERYKVLKQDERVLRAQWHATQWREMDAQLVEYTLQVQQQETRLEANQTEIGSIDLSMDQRRNDQQAASDIFQETQRRFYTAGNEVTRIEQDIRHHQEKNRQMENDIQQLDRDYQDVQQNIEEVAEELHDLANELTRLNPSAENAKAEAVTAVQQLKIAEETLQTWQTRWDEFNQRAAKSTQTAQVEQTRIQHLEQKLSSIKQRQARVEQEQGQIVFDEIENEIVALAEQITEVTGMMANRDQEMQQLNQTLSTLRTTQQQTNTSLDQVRNQIQRLRGQQSSLEALQQTALGQRNQRTTQWLEKKQLNKKLRLAQGIDVDKGWEHAVEKVLGSYLQAVCVDSISDLVANIKDFTEGSLCFFSGKTESSSTVVKGETLFSKVKSQWPLESLLGNVYVADSEEAALKLCETLSVHESVVTPNGLWFSPTWMRVSRDENPESGVFQREQELKALAQQIQELTASSVELEKKLEQTREEIKNLEKQREDWQKNANQIHAQSAELKAQQKAKQERLAELKSRVDRYRRELEESIAQADQTQSELTKSRSVWQQALQELEQQTDQRAHLSTERDTLREKVQTLRAQADQAKDQAHQLEIRAQTTRSQHASQQQVIARLKTQLTALHDRRAVLQNEFKAAVSVADLEQTLSSALNQRLQLEDELNQARNTLDAINQEMRNLEHRRQEVERELSQVRDLLETLRLEWRELKVKSESQVEQVKETGFVFEEVLKELPPESTAQEWQMQLDQVVQRITRLGPINLVAIEEYASCSERKEYLDKQHEDLQEGLNTLESAIDKIDKETRARFKETFDKVNEQFQTLFPKIFGGGRAYLELTGENLLDSGITVMACPPGKRNSTIHLLSGGEKAMTAISLIFSIFHLNPAPFCMLDEVDAPLDDANISRYCQLVKDMSEKTQFIFISHNKLAIEMAEHLIGVTMHEPGVSRLVSVDVKEAISLAGA